MQLLLNGIDTGEAEEIVHSAVQATSSDDGNLESQMTQTIGPSSSGKQTGMNTSRLEKASTSVKRRKPALSNNETHVGRGENDHDNPVLFLCVYSGSNEPIARAVAPGATDKLTFQQLSEAYRSISSGWFRLKRVTGVKFFRVSQAHRNSLCC